MEQRELLAAAAATVAPDAQADILTAADRPALFILTTCDRLPVEVCTRLRDTLQRVLEQTPFAGVPVVVLDAGMGLHAIDAHGHVLGSIEPLTTSDEPLVGLKACDPITCTARREP